MIGRSQGALFTLHACDITNGQVIRVILSKISNPWGHRYRAGVRRYSCHDKLHATLNTQQQSGRNITQILALTGNLGASA